MALSTKPKLTQVQVADAWAKYTVQAWQTKMVSLGISRRHLLQTFIWHVSENGDQVKIELFFRMYGRFVDMGVGKGVKIANVKESAASRKLQGKMIGNRRRPKKWYSKTLRHEVLRLTEILAEYYGRSAIDLITEGFVKIQE